MRRDWMVAVMVVGVCLVGSWTWRSPHSIQFGEDTGASMFQKRMLRASDVRCAFDLRLPERPIGQAGRGSGETGEQTMDLRVVGNVNNHHLVSFQDPGGEDETLPGGGGPGGPVTTSALVVGGDEFGPSCSAQSLPSGGPPAFPRCSAEGGTAGAGDKVSTCSVNSTTKVQSCSVQPNPPTNGSWYQCSVVTYTGAGGVPWSGVPTCSTVNYPNHEGFCSVFASEHVVPENPLVCSIFATSPETTGNSCSVKSGGTTIKRNMTCSVTGKSLPGGNMTAGCSVVIGAGPIGTHSSCSVTGNAKRNASCSTYSTGENVPPGEPGVAQICSVQQIGANKQGSCSVHAANVDTTHVRTCSVQSRPRGEGAFANCSVLHLEGTSTGSDSVQTCSVIGGSGTDTSYCSVMKIPQGVESNVIKCSTFVESGPLGQPGKHRCSTYVDHMGVDNNHVQPSRCSVLVPQHGGGIIVIPANPLGTECVQP